MKLGVREIFCLTWRVARSADRLPSRMKYASAASTSEDGRAAYANLTTNGGPDEEGNLESQGKFFASGNGHAFDEEEESIAMELRGM